MACAAAVATLKLFQEENLFQRAGEMGKKLGDAFLAQQKDVMNAIQRLRAEPPPMSRAASGGCLRATISGASAKCRSATAAAPI